MRSHLRKSNRIAAAVVSLCVAMSMLPGIPVTAEEPAAETQSTNPAAVFEGITPGVERAADDITMNDYQTNLLNAENGSRFAGRVWADKTVVAHNNTDGWNYITSNMTGSATPMPAGEPSTAAEPKYGEQNWTVGFKDDFLHVYSSLGSSQLTVGLPPTKTVIVIDNSGSMYDETAAAEDNDWEDGARMAKIVPAVNQSVDSLMRAGKYNEVCVVAFGNGADGVHMNEEEYKDDTAHVILPMKHYPVSDDAKTPLKYIDAGYRVTKNGDSSTPPTQPNHKNKDNDFEGGKTKTDGGFIYVDRTYIDKPEEAAGTSYYTYANGSTNINAGINKGFDVLLDSQTHINIGAQQFDFIPSLIVMTDGSATDSLTGIFSQSMSKNNLDRRGFVNDFNNKERIFTKHNSRYSTDEHTWNMFVGLTNDTPRKYQQVGYEANWTDGTEEPASEDSKAALRALAENYRDSQGFMLLNTLMNAAYMKAATSKKYARDCTVYTISVDMMDPSKITSMGSFDTIDDKHAKGDMKITSNGFTMDPQQYLDPQWLVDKGYVKGTADLNNLQESDTIYSPESFGSETILGLVEAFRDWNTWKTDAEAGRTESDLLTKKYQPINTAGGLWTKMKGNDGGEIDGPLGTYGFTKAVGKNHNDAVAVWDEQSVSFPHLQQNDSVNNPYNLTDKDVIDNIYYVKSENAYFASTSDSAENVIDDIFAQIAEDINQMAFEPVSGENASGLSDSITYEDPIGKHMEVKDRAIQIQPRDKERETQTQPGGVYDMSLYMFGSMLGVAKTAIYSPTFAASPYFQNNAQTLGENMKGGWFKPNPNPAGSDIGDQYLICDDNDLQSAHSDGTTKNSTEENWAAGYKYFVNHETAKQFLPADYVDEDGNLDRNIQEYVLYRIDAADYQAALDSTENARPNYSYGHKKENGVETKDWNQTFMINQIRIWTEESGDYDDTSGDITADVGYDQKLYVNIPVAALPLQVATVEVEQDGSVSSYTTNSEKNGSDPNQYIQSTPFRMFYSVGMADEAMSDDGLSIDLARIDLDYITKHKDDTTKNVYFYSNYYSKQSYNGYLDSKEDVTHGDPGLSFSPASDNSYYVIQQPVPLYKIFTDPEMTKPATPPSQGGARPESIEDDEFTEQVLKGDTIWENKLEGFDVTTKSGVKYYLKPISNVRDMSRGEYAEGEDTQLEWSYLVMDYYMPAADGKGRVAHRMVARNSSDFGSGLSTESAELSKMMCWYNMETHEESDIVMPENPEDFSATFGKPEEDPDKWVLATKPGSLRTGNMYEYRVEKSEEANRTHSSDTVRVPMVREITADGSVVINSYLGNEGRLATMDKMLAITKDVEADDYYKQYTSEKIFNYKVKIGNGGTGSKEGDDSAIVIKRHVVNGQTHWDYQLDSVKVNVDDQGFLTAVDSNGKTGRAVLTSNQGPGPLGDVPTFLVQVKPGHYENGAAEATESRLDSDEGKGEGEQTFTLEDVIVYSGDEKDPDGEPDGVITNMADPDPDNPDAYRNQPEDSEWIPSTGTKDNPDGIKGDGDGERVNIPIWQTGKSDPNGDFGDANADHLVDRCQITPTFRTYQVFFGYSDANDPGKIGGQWPDNWPMDKVGDKGQTTVGEYKQYDDENNFTGYEFEATEWKTDPNKPHPENFEAYTADVELKDGYGLLFNGIDDSVPYTMTEILSEDDLKAGFAFSSLEHIQSVARGSNEDRAVTMHKKDRETGEINSSGDNSSKITVDEKGKNYRYGVSGRTDGDAVQAEAAHFTNYYGPVSLTINKVVRVKDTDGTVEEVKWEPTGSLDEYKQKFNDDYGKDFTFTVSLTSPEGSMLPYATEPDEHGDLQQAKGEHGRPLIKTFKYFSDPNIADAFGVKPEDIVEYGTTEVEEGYSDSAATITFALKHDQTFGLLSLPQHSSYTVTETYNEGYTTSWSGTTTTRTELGDDGKYHDVVTEVDGSTAHGDMNEKAVSTATFYNTIGETETPPDSGKLAITKHVTGTEPSEDGSPVMPGMQLGGPSFGFDVTLTPPEGGALNSSYLYVGSGGASSGILSLAAVEDGEVGAMSGTVYLKDGETITIEGLPVGTKYKVAEKESSAYELVEMTGADGVIPSDADVAAGTAKAEAAFTNKPTGIAIIVPRPTPTPTPGPDESPNPDSTPEPSESPNPDSTPEPSESPNPDSPPTPTPTTTPTSTATPKPRNYGLSIEKVIEGAAMPNPDEEFEFEITIIPKNGTDMGSGTTQDPIASSYHCYGETVEGIEGAVAPDDFDLAITQSNENGKTVGKGRFTLKHGQRIVIANLPLGADYRVDEINGDGSYVVAPYVNGKRMPGDTYTAEGTLDVYNGDVRMVNRAVGWLGVSKTVAGGGADVNKEWSFDIEITPPDGKVFEDYLDFFENCTFTEPETGGGGETEPIAQISASDAGNNGGRLKTFTAYATSTVAKPENNDTETPLDQMAKEKYDKRVEFIIDTSAETAVAHATVTLKHGETIVIMLPAGTTYTLKEYGANEDGYKTNSNVDLTPEIFDGQISWGHFTNTKGNPDPTPTPGTSTPSPTPGGDETPPPEGEPTPTTAPTPTSVPTPTAAPTPTTAPTPTSVPTPTAAPTPTSVPTPDQTPTTAPTPTAPIPDNPVDTPTPTAAATPTAAPTPTPVPTPTLTPVPTDTPAPKITPRPNIPYVPGTPWFSTDPTPAPTAAATVPPAPTPAPPDEPSTPDEPDDPADVQNDPEASVTAAPSEDPPDTTTEPNDPRYVSGEDQGPTPKTGDSSNMALWIALAVLCLAAAAALLGTSKRKSQKNDGRRS